ncbi:VOC family protein [Acidisoma sp. 7E03]
MRKGGGRQGHESRAQTHCQLDLDSLDRSLAFYQEVLGFRVLFSRPEDRFACLDLDGVHLQIEVANVTPLYDRVLISGLAVLIPMEERWYRQGALEAGQRQFVVADPDGYLLRLFSPLGTRPVRFGSLAEMRAAFADLSDEALQALVDEAVATIRKESS